MSWSICDHFITWYAKLLSPLSDCDPWLSGSSNFLFFRIICYTLDRLDCPAFWIVWGDIAIIRGCIPCYVKHISSIVSKRFSPLLHLLQDNKEKKVTKRILLFMLNYVIKQIDVTLIMIFSFSIWVKTQKRLNCKWFSMKVRANIWTIF